jgi:Brp/Blh family beta-carotene 15,15'-monooxygenase
MQPDAVAASVVWSRRLVIGAVLFTGAMSVLVPHAAPSVAMTLAVAGFLAGVPHGAVDHLLAARLCAGRPFSVVVGVYAGLAVTVWAVLRWAGPTALLIVVALSAVHFGLGELEVFRATTGWQPDRVVALAAAVAGCGALVLPLARSGAQLQTVASAVSPDLARIIGQAPVQIALAVSWIAAATVAIRAALRAGHSTVAVDIAVIGALGVLAPPLTAFAVWFGGWHALRHTARLMTVEPGCAALLADGRRRDAAMRLARLASLPSAAALAVLAVLVWLTASANEPPVVIAEVLRILLALTVPHMVVVYWLDRLSAKDIRRAVLSSSAHRGRRLRPGAVAASTPTR